MLKIKSKLLLAGTLILIMFLGLGLVAASDINMDENISLTEHAENIQTTSNNNDMDVANENHNTMKISSKHP